MGLGDRLARGLRARRAERRGGRARGEASPEELYHRAHAERLRLLEDARGALADLAVHERRADLLARQAREAAVGLEREATAAVAAGDDQRAHVLLDRVVAAEEDARRWGERRAEFGRQVAESRRTLAGLERQADQARSHQLQLLADTHAAQARERLARATPALQEGSSEIETRLREVEAMTAARAEIAWSDSSSDQVARAFEDLEHGEDVRARLRRIEAEYGFDAPGGARPGRGPEDDGRG